SRADVAGFLGKKAGLGRDDLGRIDILPHFALAAIRRNRLQQTLRLVQGEKIKGMHTRIEQAK
ncbi:DbpA RNA binding domain-containing protein, partial [Bacteroides sp. ET71]|uniref:DbpA RNA binding domain-containing protein n=1 Tax=Bacteroides sp. ET71 TaxID=2939421 RepID=UPI0020123FF6